ncbi:MAG: N-6 DNA methylase [Nitrosomonas sp.]|nr:N-6 DNA methylase [Nitrosomonas sp.]
MNDTEFKKNLWDTAVKLRGSLSAAEYKYPVLGLVFLKYVSDIFGAQQKIIEERAADPKSDLYIEDPKSRTELLKEWVEDRSFYAADNVFWIPLEARFETLLAQASSKDIAVKLDNAMAAIEKENDKLRGVLYRDFGRLPIDAGKVGDLIGIIAKMKFDPKNHSSRDIFGEVYEYFLGNFAIEEGQKAGQFYTPRSVVRTLVEILAPFEGRIYDPCCGSGGMFVYSERFVEAHGGKKGQVSIYGQESSATTRKLGCMNLGIRGMDYDLGAEHGDTFFKDQHPDLKADYILANPPFNMEWDAGKLSEDKRWKYGVPPAKNSNYAWLQHMVSKLSDSGRAGTVLSNGSMSSSQSGENNIREAMVKADLVECMVALPGQLFTNTTIPACLWFLSKNKKSSKVGKTDRTEQILFIDARKLGGEQLTRTQVAFAENEILRIAQAYHTWRGTRWAEGEYQDVLGFCKSVSLGEIAKHGFLLSPGRYVGAEHVEDDKDTFADKMLVLTDRLGEQMANGAELDQLIRQKLGGLGYEF